MNDQTIEQPAQAIDGREVAGITGEALGKCASYILGVHDVLFAKTMTQGYAVTPNTPSANPAADSIEQEIQAKGLTAPRVTPAALQAEIVSAHYFTAADGDIGAQKCDGQPVVPPPEPLRLLTICVLVLRNGFTVHGVSACASPENFNAEIGRHIARENAEREIWPLLGFRLRDELARPVLTDADAAADLAGTPRPT